MLTDPFYRTFPYIRLSITDVCNFRCQYCLPEGYVCSNKPNFLNIEEIKRLVIAFSELGVFKVRLTGGEPTVRKDFEEIVSAISSTEAIKQLVFTTNGYRLAQNAQKWHELGLQGVNVSIDSLKPDIFYKITDHDKLNVVLSGIEQAIAVGFNSVKVNVVLLKGVNDLELRNFVAFAKDKPITIRFIELMQTGDNFKYFTQFHISSSIVTTYLAQQGWQQCTKLIGSGPAVTFRHSDYLGKIGIIAPYSKDFCKSCNRLRVTSTGDLRLCLFGNFGTSLREFLQKDSDKEILKQHIQQQLQLKKSSHFLQDGKVGITPHLASVGG